MQSKSIHIMRQLKIKIAFWCCTSAALGLIGLVGSYLVHFSGAPREAYKIYSNGSAIPLIFALLTVSAGGICAARGHRELCMRVLIGTAIGALLGELLIPGSAIGPRRNYAEFMDDPLAQMYSAMGMFAMAAVVATLFAARCPSETSN